MNQDQVIILIQRLDQIIFLLQSLLIASSFLSGLLFMQFLIHCKNQHNLF